MKRRWALLLVVGLLGLPVAHANIVYEWSGAPAKRFNNNNVDAFGAVMPNVESGACAAGTRPLYRAYNNRRDANHRYALAPWVLTITDYYIDSGPWIREGYGPDAVAMCVPQ